MTFSACIASPAETEASYKVTKRRVRHGSSPRFVVLCDLMGKVVIEDAEPPKLLPSRPGFLAAWGGIAMTVCMYAFVVGAAQKCCAMLCILLSSFRITS